MEILLTLEEAKQFLRDNWKKGVDCPCCHQFVKQYPRPMTSAMAYGLILIHRFFLKNLQKEWVHIEDYFKTLNIPSSIRGDIAKLKYWELIEAKMDTRDDGSDRNGYYKITQKGIDFVLGKIKIPAKMFMFNKRCFGFSSREISIQEALGKKFNYRELMQDQG